MGRFTGYNFHLHLRSIIAMAGGDNETRAFRVSEKVALG